MLGSLIVTLLETFFLEDEEKEIELQKCARNFFVVHEHKAKRAGLHYDLRLTYKSPFTNKCALLSFASRKLPQLARAKVKRISLFPTEDHTLDYAKFQGKIPEGYGAGTVKIWDKGPIIYHKLTLKTIVVEFKGSKLKGCYALVNLSNKKDPLKIYSRGSQWLMLRSRKC